MTDDDQTPSCYICKHLICEYESWEMPDVCYYKCRAVQAVNNLRQFPFCNTKCKRYEAKETRHDK